MIILNAVKNNFKFYIPFQSIKITYAKKHKYDNIKEKFCE
jgi:hypothetical protein